MARIYNTSFDLGRRPYPVPAYTLHTGSDQPYSSVCNCIAEPCGCNTGNPKKIAFLGPPQKAGDTAATVKGGGTPVKTQTTSEPIVQQGVQTTGSGIPFWVWIAGGIVAFMIFSGDKGEK
jgi:hypothetical protein